MTEKNTSHYWLNVLRRGSTDLWFLLSFLLAALLFVLLLGYHHTDPGWSTSGTGEGVSHPLGIVGAYISDMFFSLFGYSAYLLPIGLLFIGWHSVKKEVRDNEIIIWKILGLLVAVIAFCGILACHWHSPINSLAITGGGVVGQKMTQILLGFWSVSWVMLVYTLIFLSSITLLCEIPWLRLLELLGMPFLLLFKKLKPKDHVEDLSEKNAENEDKSVLVAHEQTSEDKRMALKDRLSFYRPRHSSSVTPTGKTEPVISLDVDCAQTSEDALSLMTNRTSTVSQDDSLSSNKLPLTDTINWKDYKTVATDWQDSPNNDDVLTKITSNNLNSYHDEDDNPQDLSHIYDDAEAFFSNAPYTVAVEDEDLAAIQGDEVDDELDENDFTTVNHHSSTADTLENGLRVRLGNRAVSSDYSTQTTHTYSPVKPVATSNPFYRDPKSELPYQLPSLSLLKISPLSELPSEQEQFQLLAPKIEEALNNYRLKVRVVGIDVGPVVTRLELDLAPGIKVSQIMNLDKDIARSLAVQSVRVVDVIPGKPYIGLEVPNKTREVVHLRKIMESNAYQDQKSPLTLVLGSDIAGKPMVANLAKMPHLLVAGTTGSGKSVAINVMLTSMLYKATPDELKLILIDPKMLEMSMYEDIPHLLTPVVTDMNDAENALRWAVAEMERRYQLMAAFKVRNIAGFNQHIRELQAQGERIDDPLWNPEDYIGLANQPPQIGPLPYIVIVIDELADMMMAVGKSVEQLIARIAQKARAAGIHLILATQRPSVDVITGLIKANVPTRLAFQVSSKIDSRTIIDRQGAEALLGYGDGLFVPPGSASPRRVHGAFIEDSEVDAITSYLKTQGVPHYEESITNPVPASALGAYGAQEKTEDSEQDPLYDEACQIVIESGKASISYLQRRLSIGYNRAAKLIEAMEYAGLVSSADRGQRKVLGGGGQNLEEDY